MKRKSKLFLVFIFHVLGFRVINEFSGALCRFFGTHSKKKLLGH